MPSYVIVPDRLPALLTWVGFWIFAFAVTHIPVPPDAPRGPEGLDKIIHFGLYCLLTLLGGRYLSRSYPAREKQWICLWALVYAFYALFDEWSQAWVGRDTSFGDFTADILGIAFGSLILMRSGENKTGR